MDTYTLLTIMHIFGVALGAGGALVSDMMFFSSVRDEKVSNTEMRFLTIGSRAVWAGLAILFISGVGLVYMSPAFLEVPKFWAKMTIVFIIFINGIIFHMYHIPRLHRHVGAHYPSSDEFIRKVPLMLASGAVSGVSWASAVVLGAWRGATFSYLQIMFVYLAVLALAISGAIIFRKRVISHPKPEHLSGDESVQDETHG